MGPDFLTWFRSRRESTAPSRSCQEMSQRSTTQIPAAPTNTATPAPSRGGPALGALRRKPNTQIKPCPGRRTVGRQVTSRHNSRSQWIGHSATAGPYIRPSQASRGDVENKAGG